MPSPYRKLIILIGLMLCMFVALEIVLEYRAIRRGWQGPWFQKIHQLLLVEAARSAAASSDGEKMQADSPVLPSADAGAAGLRIIVFGSSHTIDPRFPPEEIWPHVMQSTLKELGARNGIQRLENATLINASKIGLSLPTGYESLARALQEHRPDAVLVYELTNTINEYSKEILTLSRSSNDAASASGSNRSTGFLNHTLSLLTLLGVSPRAVIFFSDTTLYEHLKSQLGARVVAAIPKENYIGPRGESMFRGDLQRYLELCRKAGATLILSEAITGFDNNPPDDLIEAFALMCYRYNLLLSADGWSATIARFNQLAKEFAAGHEIPFVSARAVFTRPGEGLRDSVHFTREGHQRMGRSMAESLMQVWRIAP
jgi:lysophospholipase L1-like esterase